MFGGPIYCGLANRLCFVMPFVRKISHLLGIKLVSCIHYLFQMASLCPLVLTSSWTCIFLMGVILSLLVLTG